MNKALQNKVLRIAAEVCWLHGLVAGNRTCQDWGGETAILDSLTGDEKNQLMYQFEQYNSNGDDYEEGYFPHDEMVISYVMAHALEIIAVAS